MLKPPGRSYILYIEDDAEDVELLHYVLQDSSVDIKVVGVSDGVKGLEFLEDAKLMNQLPEMVFLDINTSKINGKETFVCIKADKRLSRIPVAVISTSNMDSDISYFKKYDVPYIVKPGDVKQFKQEILSVLKALLQLKVTM